MNYRLILDPPHIVKTGAATNLTDVYATLEEARKTLRLAAINDLATRRKLWQGALKVRERNLPVEQDGNGPEVAIPDPPQERDALLAMPDGGLKRGVGNW